jgi:predicted MFS family arabinose efflux permease
MNLAVAIFLCVFGFALTLMNAIMLSKLPKPAAAAALPNGSGKIVEMARNYVIVHLIAALIMLCVGTTSLFIYLYKKSTY